MLKKTIDKQQKACYY